MREGRDKRCSACRFMHRRCDAGCQLAPYFPRNQPQLFKNVHRLFGLRNTLRMLSNADPHLRPDLMRSIIYESNMTARFPADDCLAVTRRLWDQLCYAEMELAVLTYQIALRRSEMERADSNQPSETSSEKPNVAVKAELQDSRENEVKNGAVPISLLNLSIKQEEVELADGG